LGANRSCQAQNADERQNHPAHGCPLILFVRIGTLINGSSSWPLSAIP
jgi:hypothetical protein